MLEQATVITTLIISLLIAFKANKKQKRLSNTEWWTRYREYLLSDEWKAKREKALKRDNYKCQYKRFLFKCGSKTNLEVHHLTYKRVFGAERMSDLITLCKHHHQLVHKKKKKGK